MTKAPTAQASAVIVQTHPVGAIIGYGGNASSFPPGWLVCDGSPFSLAQYPELYEALGESDTLPDLRRSLTTTNAGEGATRPQDVAATYLIFAGLPQA